MRALSAFYLVLILSFSSAGAAPTTSREALFTRAFQTLPFLMTMASLDVSFRNSLTEKEKQMFQYIDTVSQDARNRQWFIANDVKNYPRDGFDVYYYAPSVGGVNPVAVARAASPIHFGLQFSSDSSLFQLNPAEPERTAMTYPDLSKDIYVNLNIINRPATQLTFAQALSILVHEIGHKLPPLNLEKDPGAINSLAAKLQAFVEAQTTSFKTATGQIQILRFKTGPFDQWLEENIFGKYQGVNVPFKLEPLRIFDGEGVYVFAENQSGVYDITTALFSAITSQDILQGDRKDYDWRNINWILASAASVKDLGGGKVKLDINMNHLQTTIPFMFAGAPDPAQYQPYNRAFPNSPPHVGRFERRQWTVNLNAGAPKIESELLYPLVFEDPTTEVKKVKVGWEGDDFVARYQIAKLPEPEWEAGKYLVRPVLIGQLNGNTVEILSTTLVAGADGIFEFRVKGLRLKNHGTLELSGMEMIPRKANLAMSTEPHIKVFLPSRESFPLAGPKVSDPSRMVSEFSWDGKAWTDLEKAQAAIPASHIRFTIEASAPVLSLKILVAYNLKGEIFADVRFGGQATPEFKTGEFTRPVLKWITLEPPSFKQELKNGKLYIDLEVDKGLLGSLIIQDFLEIPEQDRPGYMPGRGPLVAGRERVRFSAADNNRALHAVEYITQDLVAGAKAFKAPLKVIKLDATLEPTACETLLTPRSQP